MIEKRKGNYLTKRQTEIKNQNEAKREIDDRTSDRSTDKNEFRDNNNERN